MEGLFFHFSGKLLGDRLAKRETGRQQEIGTETDRDRQSQTETDRDRQRQT